MATVCLNYLFVLFVSYRPIRRCFLIHLPVDDILSFVSFYHDAIYLI